MKKRIPQAFLVGLLSAVALGTFACKGEEKPKAECSGSDQKLDPNIPGGIAICKDGKWAAPNDEFEIDYIDY